jgi:hypothetical protein
MPDGQSGPAAMTGVTDDTAPRPPRPGRRPRAGSYGGMPKEEKPAMEAELPLKKGVGRMEYANARGVAGLLRDLLARDPALFGALRAIVEGRPGEAGPPQRRALTRRTFLARDGSPDPQVKAVMLAAVRDTPDGAVLVDPFAASRPEDVEALRRAEGEWAVWLPADAMGRIRRALSDGHESNRKEDGPGR